MRVEGRDPQRVGAGPAAVAVVAATRTLSGPRGEVRSPLLTLLLGRRVLQIDSPLWKIAALYLVALATAETLAVFGDVRIGMVGHAVILIMLTAQAGLTAYTPRQQPRAHLYTALMLVPLIRIVSLGIPAATFTMVERLMILSVPLLVAGIAAMRANDYRARDIGLALPRTGRQALVTVLVSISGLGLGYLEYLILRPAPLVETLAPVPVIQTTLVLLLATGVMEEVVFRGVLQRAAIRLFGIGPGILYAAALFTILHTGYRSVLDSLFVLGVGLLFGYAVVHSRSLLGVILAHTLTNVGLFIIFPHLV